MVKSVRETVTLLGIKTVSVAVWINTILHSTLNGNNFSSNSNIHSFTSYLPNPISTVYRYRCEVAGAPILVSVLGSVCVVLVDSIQEKCMFIDVGEESKYIVSFPSSVYLD